MVDDRVFVEAEAFRLKARSLWDHIRHAAARSISNPARFHPVAGLEMFLNPERLSRHFQAAERGATDGNRNHPPVDAEELSAFEAGVRMKCNDAMFRLKRQTDAALVGYESKLFAIDIQPIGTALARIEAAAERRFQTFFQEGREQLIQLRKAEVLAEREMNRFIVHNRLDRGPKPLKPLGLTVGLLVLLILIEGAANSAIFGSTTPFGLIGGFAVAVLIACANVLFAFFTGMVLLRNWIHQRPYRRVAGVVATLIAVSLLLWLQVTLAKLRSMIEGAPLLPTVGQVVDGHPSWSLPALALLIVSASFALVALTDGFCIAGDPYPGYSAMARTKTNARQAFLRALKRFRDGAAQLIGAAQSEVERLLGDAKRALFIYQQLSAEFRSVATLYEQNAHQIENACDRVIQDYREKNLFVRGGVGPAYFEEYLPLDWAIGRDIGDPGERLQIFTAAVDEMERDAEEAKTRLHRKLVQHLGDIDDDLTSIDEAATARAARENAVFEQAAEIEV